MNYKRLAIIMVSAVLALAVLGGVLLSMVCKKLNIGTDSTTDTTTCMIVSYDTIPYLMPVVKDSVVVKYVVKKLPINRRDTTINCQEMARNIQDTATVTIPITQKRYEDSTYTAWVSGYEASLDSIKVYQRTQTIYNTVRERRKIPPWSIGVTAGYGVGKGGLTPYIGVGLTYKLWDIK